MYIREFLATDIEAVKKFTDTAVGLGYYSVEELIENQKKSVAASGEICSFVLVKEHETESKVYGLRLAFPPGNWDHGKGGQLRPDLWPTPLEKTAYFQSLFVSAELQGQGWGPKLSAESIKVFKKLGALGIVAHCWKESPNNSSQRYLLNIGFKPLVEHPDYWVNVNYVCTRDGYPCHCTAIEMHLPL
ncbi:MAG: GNAT family N-acetyltransferase [Pseudobdellovibrio sp.]